MAFNMTFADRQIVPAHLETIVALANLIRRMHGVDAAIAVYTSMLDNPQYDIYTKGALTAEWARLIWKVKGNVDEARQVYQKNHHWYLDSRCFWINWLKFEMEQPTKPDSDAQYIKIKQVHSDIR